jgi:hypothetical protein
MAIELHHERDNIFRIDLTAKLRQAEFKQCQDQILQEVSRLGPVRLLFVLDGFEGWESQDNWGDLSFFVRHGDSIARIAIVGEERWRDLALMFAAADLRRAPVDFLLQTISSTHNAWLSQA